MTLNTNFTAGLEARLQQLRDEQRLQAAQLPRLAAGRARDDGRARRGADPVVEQLPRPLRTSRRWWRRASTGWSGSAPARAASASSAAPSPCTASSRQALARFVGTEASMSYVSAWNANEGLTATVVEEGDFVVLRRAQPRVDHRLDPAGEVDHEVHHGRLQARRPGRPAREAGGRQGREAADRLERRRLLDGRLDRAAARTCSRSAATTTRCS